MAPPPFWVPKPRHILLHIEPTKHKYKKKKINNNKPITRPKLRTSTIQFIHVLDGEGEAGERLPGGRWWRLREGEELEPLDEGAKVCSDDRGVVHPFEPPPGLGQDQDAGDGDANYDPDLRGGEIELRSHFHG